eukprot:7387395-Prymnesium_polylepis.1
MTRHVLEDAAVSDARVAAGLRAARDAYGARTAHERHTRRQGTAGALGHVLLRPHLDGALTLTPPP